MKNLRTETIKYYLNNWYQYTDTIVTYDVYQEKSQSADIDEVDTLYQAMKER